MTREHLTSDMAQYQKTMWQPPELLPCQGLAETCLCYQKCFQEIARAVYVTGAKLWLVHIYSGSGLVSTQVKCNQYSVTKTTKNHPEREKAPMVAS